MLQGSQATAYSQQVPQYGTPIPLAAEKARSIIAGLQARKDKANTLLGNAIAMGELSFALPQALPDNDMPNGTAFSADLLKMARGAIQPLAALLGTASIPSVAPPAQRFTVAQAENATRMASIPQAKEPDALAVS